MKLLDAIMCIVVAMLAALIVLLGLRIHLRERDMRQILEESKPKPYVVEATNSITIITNVLPCPECQKRQSIITPVPMPIYTPGPTTIIPAPIEYDTGSLRWLTNAVREALRFTNSDVWITLEAITGSTNGLIPATHTNTPAK